MDKVVKIKLKLTDISVAKEQKGWTGGVGIEKRVGEGQEGREKGGGGRRTKPAFCSCSTSILLGHKWRCNIITDDATKMRQ